MILHVFKRKRRRRGRLIVAKTYCGRYQLPSDAKPTVIPLRVTDKRVAEQRLRDIVQAAERERAGIALPLHLVEAAAKPMLDHLDDFTSDLRARGRNRRYVREVAYRVRSLLAACKWTHQRDITADSFLEWRKLQSKSAKTVNDYLAAMTGFLRWMISNRRMIESPLRVIGRVDGRGKETFTRRVLSADEFERLLAVAGPRRVL